MRRYILSRVGILIPLLLGVSFVTFVLIHLAGSDPAEAALRVNEIVPTEETIALMRHELGLDQPFLTRYITWLLNVIHGDFGKSYADNIPVSVKIAQALPATLILAFTALGITLFVSLFAGILCAQYEGSIGDIAGRALIFLGTSMPVFWSGLLLMWLFSVRLNIFPTSGMTTPLSVVLPAVTLSLAYICTYARLIRNNMCDVKRENYVLYLRARGLKETTVTAHILKNSVQTSLTALGMSIPKLIAGTVIVENIFAWPGIGRLCVTAIFNRDFPIILAYVLLMAVLFVICNLLVDIASALLDPRIKQSYR